MPYFYLTKQKKKIATSWDICQRKTQIYGSLGELRLDDKDGVIIHYDFASKKSNRIIPECPIINTSLQGHGGADWHLVNQFIEAIRTNSPSKILSGPDETLESHLMVFAAEKSRLQSTVVTLQ